MPPETILCPHDQVPMAHRIRHGISVHACNWCRSLWLPATSWLELCRLARLPPVSFHTGGQSARHPKRTCPDCLGQSLLSRHVRNIEIDVCPSCGGVWLDHEEIQRLLGLPVTDEKTPAQRSLANASYGQNQGGSNGYDLAGDLGLSGLELLAEIIGGFLTP